MPPSLLARDEVIEIGMRLAAAHESQLARSYSHLRVDLRSLLGELRTWMDLRPPVSRSKMTPSSHLLAIFVVLHNVALI